MKKKENKIKKAYVNGRDILAVDLPGAYSMSPFTSEESITSSYVIKEKPDVIINIVDADNLSRSLFFTTQLLELGIPVVVALNKSDIIEKKGIKIDVEELSKQLNCAVIKTISTKSKGLKELIHCAISCVGNSQMPPYKQEEINLVDRELVKSVDKKRFEFVDNIVKSVEKRKTNLNNKNYGDKIDAVLTNKWLGIPIFAVVMSLVFFISQSEIPVIGIGKMLEGVLTEIINIFQNWVAKLMSNSNSVLKAVVIDGIIGGVSAVMGFLPLVMVMYFLIAILEDCGYMSRAAVVLDPIFKRVGLSGKSVIPFVITIGCAVPGIMASRTIRNERERRATAMLAPFIPCGAKIPVIALFAGAFFKNAWWLSALMYFSGIVLIFVGALLINLITGYKSKKSFFIIELPEYKKPSLWGAFKSMCSRGWAYIVKAATIILLCNMAVQLMQMFTWSFTVAESAEQSILASIAMPFAYVLVPIVGVLSWQLAAAAITGFIAKENVVSTLAVCFVGLENFIDMEELAILQGAGAEVSGIMAITKVAALAYLMFNLYTPPCFAAIGAMNSEMKSKKWFWGGIGFQLAIGYTIAYLIYTIGTLIVAPATLNIVAAIVGFIAVLFITSSILVLILNTNKKLK